MNKIEVFIRDYQFLNNNIILWIISIIIFSVFVIFCMRLRSIIKIFVKRFSIFGKNFIKTSIETMILNICSLFVFTLGLYLASLVLVLPMQVSRFLTGVTLVATVIQLGIWFDAIAALWIDNKLLDKENPDPERSSVAQVIRIIVLALVWTTVFLLSLSSCGVDITALIAGLGVGGVAVAFALQSLLKDLFASLSILLDKPFVVGDLVFFDEHRGVVEKVGLRTTRLRSLSGEQISVSNDMLLTKKLRNFQRMTERRIQFRLHVQYGASASSLEKFPAYLQLTIKKFQGVRFDRAHLSELNELGVRFEAVYYVLSPEYTDYLDIHQRILLASARWFEKNKIHFSHSSY